MAFTDFFTRFNKELLEGFAHKVSETAGVDGGSLSRRSPRSAKGMSGPTLVQLLHFHPKTDRRVRLLSDTILYLGLTPLEEPGLSS